MHENSENKKEKQQNDTVLLMVEWIKHNAVLVFVLGIVLMIITSIIAFMGWAVLVCLLMLLYFICANEKIAEEYTVDRKLEEKVDVVGSSLVNSVENSRISNRYRRYRQSTREPRTWLQWGVIAMALICLVTIFYGPFASDALSVVQGHTISNTLLFAFNRFSALHYRLIAWVMWLFIVAIPITIIIITLKNIKHNREFAFVLSLLETIVLLIWLFELVFLNVGIKVGLGTITGSRLYRIQTNIISFGVSAYLLIVASCITSVVTFKSWFSYIKDKNKNTK